MSLFRYLADVRQAIENLRAQATRTLLTALGIVFGVGSVIGMLSIGAGAREESLRMIEKLGVRNLLVESRPATSQEELQQRRRTSPGLTERDVRILQANVEDLEMLSPRRTLRPSRVLPKAAQQVPELYGVRPSYSIIHSLQPVEGRFFTDDDDNASAPVCVLGENAKVSLLGYGPAVGKFVKLNDSWLEGRGRAERCDQYRLHSPEHVPIPVLGPQQFHEGRARRHRSAAQIGDPQRRSRQSGHGHSERDASQHAGFHV